MLPNFLKKLWNHKIRYVPILLCIVILYIFYLGLKQFVDNRIITYIEAYDRFKDSQKDVGGIDPNGTDGQPGKLDHSS